MWLAVTGAVILFLLALVLIAPVTVHVKYSYFGLEAPGEHDLHEYVPHRGVRVSLFWGLLNLTLKLSSVRLVYRAFTPVLKLKARLKKGPGSTLAGEKTRITPAGILELIQKANKLYQAIAPAYRKLLAGTVLHRYCWSTGIGLPEAGQTGLAVGLLWLIKSNATALVYRGITRPAPRPDLEVMPVFDRQLLRINFDCIFSLRTGYIIYTGLLAGWYLLKNRHRLRK